MTKDIHETKGTDLRALRAFVEQEFGPIKYIQWTEALDEEAADLYSTSTITLINASKWYNTRQFPLIPLEVACDLFLDGNVEKGAWSFGRFSADFGFSGVYRLILRHGPALTMIKQAPKIMSLYLRPGVVKIGATTRNSCVIEFIDIPPHASYEFQNAGFIERLMEMTGNDKDYLKIPMALSRGDSHTEVSFGWKA